MVLLGNLSLVILLTALSGANAIALTNAPLAGVSHLVKRAPVCRAKNDQSSFFPKTNVYIGITYPQFLLDAKLRLGKLSRRLVPRSLNLTVETYPDPPVDGKCDPRDNNAVNPDFYPVPPPDSSICPRRDQDVHFVLYRQILDKALDDAPLAPAGFQDPLSVDCQNTVTFSDINTALENLYSGYDAMLTAVDKQTCLAGFSDTSTVYTQLFDHPVADLTKDTKIYSIIHAYSTIIASATYKGEEFNTQGKITISDIYTRFSDSQNLMQIRNGCKNDIRNKCKLLNVPLEPRGLIGEVLSIVGIESDCPAMMQ
ncbi:hypothetical protein TWF694_010880 [Orbilia ellipsospora]|uniref:Uncharacterized protein n=1 Tax=Orbilia ellipsospora TaxID=2528407 RepID=A0AAV9X8I2_9PEZI